MSFKEWSIENNTLINIKNFCRKYLVGVGICHVDDCIFHSNCSNKSWVSFHNKGSNKAAKLFRDYLNELFDTNAEKSSYLWYMIKNCSKRKKADFSYNYGHQQLLFFHFINNQQFDRYYSLWNYLNNYLEKQYEKYYINKNSRKSLLILRRYFGNFKPSFDHKDALNTLFEFDYSNYSFAISPTNLHIISLQENMCKSDWSWEAWCEHKRKNKVEIYLSFIENISTLSNKQILKKIKKEIKKRRKNIYGHK